MSVSLDGFVAGPDQTREDPLGIGAEDLHRWMFSDPMHPADQAARDHLAQQRGAYVMGRNMFGPIRGEWSEDWRGWWGDDPPYHAPVFVLTHHQRESVEMAGGTTFHFVTDGFDEAFRRAREAAADRDVLIAGGASVIQQALRARVLDELFLDIAPVLLGHGERLLADVGDTRFDPVEVVGSPLATHVRYEVSYSVAAEGVDR